jgi:hypothetical protein
MSEKKQATLQDVLNKLDGMFAAMERHSRNFVQHMEKFHETGRLAREEGRKPGQVDSGKEGSVQIRRMIGFGVALATITGLAWGAGEVANWSVGSGATRIDQAARTSQQILVADVVQCGSFTNTAGAALGAGSTVNALAIAAGPSTTAPLIQWYTLTGTANHTVLTQALTKVYGSGVSPTVTVSPSAVDAGLCVSAVASNSIQVTITAGTATYYVQVIGAMP